MMKLLNYFLVFFGLVLINCVLTLYIVNNYSPKQKTLSFAALDYKRIADDFSDDLNSTKLEPEERTKRIDQFTRRLIKVVDAYEAKTGSIVLRKTALVVPDTKDITYLVEPIILGKKVNSDKQPIKQEKQDIK